MITTTHAVINAVIAHRSRGRSAGVFASTSSRRAFVVGGVAPDLALYVLSAAALIYYPLADGLSFSDAHQRAMEDLFFNSTWWIVGHNTLHAPIVLAVLLLGGWTLRSPLRDRVQAFAAGAGLHSVIDVLTHHDDGPLVLFPFSLSVRLSSPVSYWNPDHFGWFMRPIDVSISVLGVAWFARHWHRRSHLNVA